MSVYEETKHVKFYYSVHKLLQPVQGMLMPLSHYEYIEMKSPQGYKHFFGSC